MEHPGRRLAVAEAAVAAFGEFCQDAAADQVERLKHLTELTNRSQEQLTAALEACVAGTGGFSWFGGRTRRLLRVFVDRLAAMARQCLTEDLNAAVWQMYTALRARLVDRLEDLTSCRQRLRHLQQALDAEPTGLDDDSVPEVSPSPTPLLSTESFWESVRGSATAKVVLPEGEKDLERSAYHFLSGLGAEQWAQLDQAFQDQVLGPLGGLYRAVGAADLMRQLAVPLLSQATATLGGCLPITDVAQAEFSRVADPEALGAELAARVEEYHEKAAPLVGAAAGVASGQHSRLAEAPAAPQASREHSFLLIPASEAGKAFGELACQALPEINLVHVPGQADLMFCREQGQLDVDDLERILKSCRAAYDDAAAVPHSSPHARCDIQDWTPLDP
jgi:hypothetical protein